MNGMAEVMAELARADRYLDNARTYLTIISARVAAATAKGVPTETLRRQHVAAQDAFDVASTTHAVAVKAALITWGAEAPERKRVEKEADRFAAAGF